MQSIAYIELVILFASEILPSEDEIWIKTIKKKKKKKKKKKSRKLHRIENHRKTGECNVISYRLSVKYKSLKIKMATVLW